jgi:ABC-type nitrate/sulfonate/bicarbonate transport system ATPase subunit
VIHADSLTFRYGKQPPIFQDFSWQVERGQSWAVIGASGCGKSTLLYLLAGLRHATSGQLMINGAPISRPRPHTGLILQDYGLLPWATIRQNVSLGLDIRQFYGPDTRHAPAEGIPADASNQVTLWLEQRQRAAIARTLVLEPDLLLMDEPFASLDAPTRESLQALVLELARERSLTTILVTHTIEEALFIGEKILVLTNRTNTNPLVLENPFAGMLPPVQAEAYTTLTTRIRSELKDSAA